MAWLVQRYLAAFGPASVADIGQFTLLRRAVVHEAIASLGDAHRVAPGTGPGAPATTSRVPPCPTRTRPRRHACCRCGTASCWPTPTGSRIIPEAYRKTVIRTNGDTLPTLLVDGLVAGVWRPVDGGIEATAFHALPEAAWAGLADEARALVAFLAERDPSVYRRYARWWTKIDGAEVRVLPG